MGDRAQLHRLIGSIGTLWDAGFGGSEDQSDPRPFWLGIFQHQLSLMIFHDLLDDGETEARALAARGHIRLGKAIAPFLPTYHYAQLAWSALGAGSETLGTSLLWLAGYTALFLTLAVRAYRREERAKFA